MQALEVLDKVGCGSAQLQELTTEAHTSFRGAFEDCLKKGLASQATFLRSLFVATPCPAMRAILPSAIA
eukprot:3526060-Alexandrium_andersonii.AAC.1